MSGSEKISVLEPGMLVQPNMDFWLNYHWEYWSIKCKNAPSGWTSDDKFLLMQIMNEAHNGLVLSDVVYQTSVGAHNDDRPKYVGTWNDPLRVRVVTILFGIREVVFTINDGFSKKISLSEFDNAFKIVGNSNK